MHAKSGALLVVLLSFAAVAQTTTPTLPEKVQPFAELSRLCAEYEKHVTVVQWREVWRQTYDLAGSEKWLPPPKEGEEQPVFRGRRERYVAPAVSAERIDGRDCAILDASEMQDAFYPIGASQVRGEFAIEFVGKALSDRPCDLSISCTRSMQIGPALEFGAHWNKANFLRVPMPDGGSQRTSLPREPLIDPDKWHTVRLDVRGGKMTATIDGQVLKSVEARTDSDRPWQANIYIYQSKIAVDEVKIETNAPSRSDANPAGVFAKVFGERPREQVLGQITQLVDLLGDGDYQVREAAHTLLKPMGTITRDALQAAAESGAPEQAMRAKQLLDLLPPAP